MSITDNDLALFRERAKTELKSTGDIGRLAWDDVVEALCKEVARLRSVSKERGEASKLREALVSAIGTLKKLYAPSKRTAGLIVTCRQKCEAALAATEKEGDAK